MGSCSLGKKMSWVEWKKRFSVVAVVFEPKGNAFLCFSFGFYINAAPPSQKHRCKDTFFLFHLSVAGEGMKKKKKPRRRQQFNLNNVNFHANENDFKRETQRSPTPKTNSTTSLPLQMQRRQQHGQLRKSNTSNILNNEKQQWWHPPNPQKRVSLGTRKKLRGLRVKREVTIYNEGS